MPKMTAPPKPVEVAQPVKQPTKTQAPPTNGSGKKNGKKKAPVEQREILYPRIETRIFCRDPQKVPVGKEVSSLTERIAKELLGWQDEDDYAASLKEQLSAPEFKTANLKFGDDFLFIDRYGKKVRCMNNLHNRPFDPRNAEDYMLEILRGKWRFNGEAMIIDKYGGVQDAQHRLVGLVWAVQEWEKDNILPVPEQQWGQIWSATPVVDSLVVLGIDDTDDVTNTLNTGKPRSWADALYRSEVYKSSPPEERARLSKITQGAVAFLWKRTDAAARSLAPRRPHSESFEYLENHNRITECVKFILAEAGDSKKITAFMSLGYAAGLLYMMGSATSSIEKYAAADCKESALDWKLWDKAQEFFVLFCSNHGSLEPLHEELNRLPVELMSVTFRVALVVKAWGLWSDKKKLTQENLELVITEGASGSELGEHPRIGGIDVEQDDEPEEVEEGQEGEPEGESVDAMAARGVCPKLTVVNEKETPHEWVTDKTGTFCKHCIYQKPKSSKGKKK